MDLARIRPQHNAYKADWYVEYEKTFPEGDVFEH